ncbi:hypothetical protein TIFTF001_005149 [Ficus carica]|uniref:EF-hand domain-containing protein n=1 Tax=Ficus carica TaxID=3494 RepID=A0AA87ZXE9_FICCA|nr:hypothetical protein TIFTF001_005149 [Ficus carica]
MVMEPAMPMIITARHIGNRKAKVRCNKEKLKEVFKRHDVNGDGRLSQEEIRKAFNDLGSNCGLYRAWIALPRADKDKDGYINITNQELDDLVDYAYERGYMHD